MRGEQAASTGLVSIYFNLLQLLARLSSAGRYMAVGVPKRKIRQTENFRHN